MEKEFVLSLSQSYRQDLLDAIQLAEQGLLSPSQQACEVMISLYVEQLSVSETAAKLGVEKNTVSTHRRNACEKIRKEMEGN